MKELVINKKIKDIRIKLDSPCIIYCSDVSNINELYEDLIEGFQGKIEAEFNGKDILKNEFNVINIDSTCTIDTDLKMASKSLSLKTIENIVDNDDGQFEKINDDIKELFKKLFNLLNNDIFGEDACVDGIPDIKQVIKDYYGSIAKGNSVESGTEKVFKLIEKCINTKTVLIVNDYPRELSLARAFEIIEHIRISYAIPCIYITKDPSFVYYSIISKMNVLIYKKQLLVSFENICDSLSQDEQVYFNNYINKEEMNKNLLDVIGVLNCKDNIELENFLFFIKKYKHISLETVNALKLFFSYFQ